MTQDSNDKSRRQFLANSTILGAAAKDGRTLLTEPEAKTVLAAYSVPVPDTTPEMVEVAPASVSEDGATNLTYTVTRSLNLSSPTVVNITTSGTATSGSDYTGGVATVTVPAGATTATITIDPTVDGTVEADETVALTVAAVAGMWPEMTHRVGRQMKNLPPLLAPLGLAAASGTSLTASAPSPAPSPSPAGR